MDGDGSVPFDNLGTVETLKTLVVAHWNLNLPIMVKLLMTSRLLQGDGSAGTITINCRRGFLYNEENQAIEIGEISSDGQDGSALKIDFKESVASNFLNGDFIDGTPNPMTMDQLVCNRAAHQFCNTFQVNGIDIPTPSDADMQSFSLVDVAHPSNNLGGQTPALN